MAKKRIPWDSEEEIERLKELVKEGGEDVDFDEITRTINKEFRDNRPKNDDGKRMKRSRDSVYWFYQRLGRKPSDGTSRRRRKSSVPDVTPPSDGYKITVTDSTGNVVCLFTTEKGIDEINASLKDLF